MDLEKYKPNREFLLYKTPNGDVKVDVLLQNETIWMPQKKIAELFDVQRPAITKHLKNIFESGELDEKVVCSILELPTQHGAIAYKTQNNPTKFYNLDAIIAVGYRVNSKRATQFRIAEKEYDRYKPIQDRLFESDFDKMINKQMRNPLIT